MEADKLALLTEEERHWLDAVGFAQADRPEAQNAIAGFAERLNASRAEHEATKAELATLRESLIKAGRAAGCLLADDVSNDFLSHVHEQVTGLAEAKK